MCVYKGRVSHGDEETEAATMVKPTTNTFTAYSQPNRQKHNSLLEKLGEIQDLNNEQKIELLVLACQKSVAFVLVCQRLSPSKGFTPHNDCC